MLYHVRHGSFFSALIGAAGLFLTQTGNTAPVDDPDNPIAPIVDTTAPSAVTVPAVGPFNATTPVISLDVNADLTNSSGVVVNDDSGDTTGTPSGKLGPLLPGTYTITWTATDLGNNSTSVDQTIDVLPIVNFGVDQTLGESNGAKIVTGYLTAYLSGPAPAGNVTVPFTIHGSSTATLADHSIDDTVDITIAAGDTSYSLPFTITDDGTGEADQTVVIDMDAPTNAVQGTKIQHTITITESNLPPTAKIKASQDGGTTFTRSIITSDGIVTLTAIASDPNEPDDTTLTFDWSATDNSLVPASGTTSSTFTFDPSGLTTGAYTARLTVSDGTNATSSELVLAIFDTAFTVSDTADTDDTDDDTIVDATEGFGDTDQDGIPNYLDAVENPSWLPGWTATSYDATLLKSNSFLSDTITIDWAIDSSAPGSQAAASSRVFFPLLISTDPGIQLGLGNIPFITGINYARVPTATIKSITGVDIPTGAITTDGKIVDVTATNLANAGQSINIVIPQSAPLPPSGGTPALAFYVYDSARTWKIFDTSGGNAINTTDKDIASGFCPAAGDAAYNQVLAAGRECIQLTIVDGGPNDRDGEANGTIQLRGAPFVAGTQTTSSTGTTTFTGTTESTTEALNKNATTDGGGGALGWSLLLSGLLAGFRLKRLVKANTAKATR